MVAELCNLIHAHLGDKYYLRCEVAYPNFLKKSYPHIGKKARVDLSVWRSVTDSDGKTRFRPKFAIEVKRASASKARINEDLVRLAAIAEESSGIRSFLCVVSEKHLPKDFVSAQGNRKLTPVPIEGTKSSYQVISVVKAASSFKEEKISEAHYCCIVEVLTNQYIEEKGRDEED